MKFLNLSNNLLTNLENKFSELSELESLDISNNSFDVFPFVLLDLPKLTKVNLIGNLFTEEYSFLNDKTKSFEEHRSRLKLLNENGSRSFKEDIFGDII